MIWMVSFYRKLSSRYLLNRILDMLEEFCATGRGVSNIAPRSPLPSGDSKEISAEDPVTALGVTEKDFAKQLQEGMANLLGELETSVRNLHIGYLTFINRVAAGSTSSI